MEKEGDEKPNSKNYLECLNTFEKVTRIRAIATFERQLLLERQAEGIALAKQKGKYKGRKPTARAKQTQVRELLAGGMSFSSMYILNLTMSTKDYNEQSFIDKCKKYGKAIGEESLEKVLYLYYGLDSPNCNIAHKGTIYGALAYLVSPIDAIPDLTPILGYTDDMSLITLALASAATCIDKNVRTKAKKRAKEFFS